MFSPFLCEPKVFIFKKQIIKNPVFHRIEASLTNWKKKKKILLQQGGDSSYYIIKKI